MTVQRLLPKLRIGPALEQLTVSNANNLVVNGANQDETSLRIARDGYDASGGLGRLTGDVTDYFANDTTHFDYLSTWGGNQSLVRQGYLRVNGYYDDERSGNYKAITNNVFQYFPIVDVHGNKICPFMFFHVSDVTARSYGGDGQSSSDPNYARDQARRNLYATKPLAASVDAAAAGTKFPSLFDAGQQLSVPSFSGAAYPPIDFHYKSNSIHRHLMISWSEDFIFVDYKLAGYTDTYEPPQLAIEWFALGVACWPTFDPNATLPGS